MLADITEHHTAEDKLYLYAIKDVWSHSIVGYSIDARMKSRLAVAALDNAAARRGELAGCILHTDRGSQFRSRKFVRALHRHPMAGSMFRARPEAVCEWCGAGGKLREWRTAELTLCDACDQCFPDPSYEVRDA